MALVLNRLKGKGLYFFDEPEAALSPTPQLSLLVAMQGAMWIAPSASAPSSASKTRYPASLRTR